MPFPFLSMTPPAGPGRHTSWQGRRRYAPAAAAVLLVLAAAAYSPSATDTSAPDAAAGAEGAGAAPSFPTHVHALALKPGTTEVLIASHEGIFEVSGDALTATGANVDLMGFTVAADGDYLASGHPGPGVDLPEPAGLISSVDGESWSVESLGGESDFHALTATSGGIIGFDGTLRLSRDGKTWTEARTQLRPYSLAGSPAGPLAVATSESGPYVSRDAGDQWSALPDAPVIVVAAVTDSSRIVGVLPDGGIVTSADEGRTWAAAGSVTGYPVAVTAAETPDGLHIWVMTDAGLEHSIDGGQQFHTVVKQPGAAS